MKPSVQADHTYFALTPCFRACFAMLAERVMSSYELLVQLPMRATEGGIERGCVNKVYKLHIV